MFAVGNPRLPQLVSTDDGTRDAVRATQEFGNLVQLSVSQGAAHAGATDDLGTDVNGSHGVDGEPQFATQGSQERNIAATTMTKVESLTHGEAAETAESVDQIP